jgi:uncharacterized membrane protein YsdA (DUF1294 family)
MTRRARRRSPKLTFLVVSAAVVAGLTALGALRLRVPWLYAYLIAVNLWTFASYGCDKAAAPRGWRRVPELVLHLLALAGGTPAAWLGQRAFRHKTLKGPFQRAFWLIALLQALAISAWAYCF